MINKRGYSFGPDLPIHYERRNDGWAVFDARDERDIGTGLTEWEAKALAERENGLAGPNAEQVEEFDSTP